MQVINLSKGYKTIIDDEDADRVNCFYWSALVNRSAIYAKKTVQIKGKAIAILMHRFIVGLQNGEAVEVDHINGDTLDNRKSNLRICTSQQNKFNRRPKNTSGFKGVTFEKRRKHWVAQIMKNKKHFHIGSFSRKEDAALAYNKKAKELFGEFACLNQVGEN